MRLFVVCIIASALFSFQFGRILNQYIHNLGIRITVVLITGLLGVLLIYADDSFWLPAIGRYYFLFLTFAAIMIMQSLSLPIYAVLDLKQSKVNISLSEWFGSILLAIAIPTIYQNTLISELKILINESLTKGIIGQALNLSERILLIEPGNQELLLMKKQLVLKLNQLQQESENPKNNDIRRAEILAQCGKFKSALEILEVTDSQSVQKHLLEGSIHQQLKHYNESIKKYELVLKFASTIEPEDIRSNLYRRCYSAISFNYIQLGYYDNAIKARIECTNREPSKYIEDLLEIAAIYHQANNNYKSLATLLRLKKIAPISIQWKVDQLIRKIKLESKSCLMTNNF